ncbi:MAG: topoisomerase C-terminal repeat-containing protein [Treponema sp.]|nr:topoisomerase C-terminal repeat-containing protein [Treponema sp.]
MKDVNFTHYDTARRFWVSEALTPDVVRSGIKASRPLSEYDYLEVRGKARQHADWLIGMNCTRLLTCSSGKFLTFGRVQTAVLNAIVARDAEIDGFKPEPYYQVRLSCDKGGTVFPMYLLSGDGKSDRFLPGDKHLEGCLSAVLPASQLSVISVDSQRKTEKPPALFNLTELQRECSTKLGLKPKDTLAVVQSLYEELKCMSYPRTASRYLGDENVDLFREKFDLLSKAYAPQASGCNRDMISGDNHDIFNSKKVEGHHALIPLAILPSSATDVQSKVYSVVLERFFAVVKKPYVYDLVSVIAEGFGYKFKAAGTSVVQYGWHKGIEDASDDGEDDGKCSLPVLAEGDSVRVVDLEKLEKKTKPPKRFTNSSLLALMQNPKGSDGEGKLVGLGTEATRASIIDELVQRRYIEQKGKVLSSTVEGKFLISSVGSIPSLAELVSIGTTTRWEALLDSDPGKFLEGIRLFVTQEVPKMTVGKKWAAPEKESLGKCPVCGSGSIQEGRKSFFCSGYTKGCQFIIWKDFCGAAVSASDVKLLLQGKMTRPKKMKTKSGKEFTAALKVAGGKVAPVFGKSEPLGKCPVCGKGSVLEGGKSFFCSEYKQGCGFSVWKEMCGAAVTAADVRLLVQGKTAKPRTMKSKAGKEFTAGLKLENGKVAFVFEQKGGKNS